MARRTSAPRNAEIDRFYVALTTLLRNFQFRDRERQTVCGITVNQCYALDVIAREQRLTVSAIGERLALNKSNASRIVDSLEALQLATRATDDTNHRLRWITVTPAGRRLHGRIMRELKRDYARILARFDRRFIHEVTGLLHVIAERARQSPRIRCQ